MSELRPQPTSILIRRAIAQWDRESSVFDLQKRRFFRGVAGLDLSVSFHGERASTVIGPAAGPHTQMAQNIALAYLAGARIFELKTVQVLDRLVISRPCIDMATVGFNVEWSQELEVQEAAHEYAKGAYLIQALRAMRIPENMPAGSEDILFDVSVGYDLEGIRSHKVTRFLKTMLDASDEIDSIRASLRRELPRELHFLAEIPVEPKLSDCVTLSTFHGCPADQIEAICTHLIEEMGMHVVVKMNPTMMGYQEVTELIRGKLGYDELVMPEDAFENDPTFDEGVDLLKRLEAVGKKAGRMVGAKFTNTLIVKNHKDFFSDKVMYLSGQPLYVLSLGLAARFRDVMGAGFPISYSAGIDAKNYVDAVSCGMTPITVCTDLLRPGGYGRLTSYHRVLGVAMKEHGAGTIPELIAGIDGEGVDPENRDALLDASLRNHHKAAARALEDPRYRFDKNSTAPKKIGSKLFLFDCVNCDKCVPVCPNDANFTYEVPTRTIVYRDYVVQGGKLTPEQSDSTLEIGSGKRPTHQLANFADLCNDCGNCDIFCPEDGGPYIVKPRLFGSRGDFDGNGGGGFYLERRGTALVVLGRQGDWNVQLLIDGDIATYYDGVAELVFSGDDPAPSEARMIGDAPDGHVVPVGFYHSLRALVDGMLAGEAASFVAVALEQETL